MPGPGQSTQEVGYTTRRDLPVFLAIRQTDRFLKNHYSFFEARQTRWNKRRLAGNARIEYPGMQISNERMIKFESNTDASGDIWTLWHNPVLYPIGNVPLTPDRSDSFRHELTTRQDVSESVISHPYFDLIAANAQELIQHLNLPSLRSEVSEQVQGVFERVNIGDVADLIVFTGTRILVFFPQETRNDRRLSHILDGLKEKSGGSITPEFFAVAQKESNSSNGGHIVQITSIPLPQVSIT